MNYSRWKKGTMDHDSDGRKGGSLPTNPRETKIMANEKDKVVTVNEGATYQRKDSEATDEGARVVAFHVDRPRSNVLFAPLGSGREDRLTIDEFLDQFELIAEEGQPLPEDKKANDAGNRQVEKDRAAALEANSRDNPALRNTTRTDLDARAAKRNER